MTKDQCDWESRDRIEKKKSADTILERPVSRKSVSFEKKNVSCVLVLYLYTIAHRTDFTRFFPPQYSSRQFGCWFQMSSLSALYTWYFIFTLCSHRHTAWNLFKALVCAIEQKTNKHTTTAAYKNADPLILAHRRFYANVKHAYIHTHTVTSV